MVPIMQPQQQQIMQTSNLVHKHQNNKSSKQSSFYVKFNQSGRNEKLLIWIKTACTF